MCIAFLPDLWYNTGKEKNRIFSRMCGGDTNGEQMLALTLTAKVMTEGLKQFVKGGIYYV